MITGKELADLVATDTHDHNVLSLYWATDLTQQTKEARRLALKQMLDRFGDEAKADVERVRKFFDHEFDWQCKGIALFSSVPANFWREVRLAVPVLNYASWEPKPNVRVLTDLMDEYESFAVALVDREHARLFALQLGEIVEFSRDLPPTPGRQKKGTDITPHLQAHVETLALQNLKQAAKWVAEFYKSQACSRLVLAGTEDVLAQFRELLPKSLQKRIVGEFPIDIRAPASVVLDKAREIQERVKREHEVTQVEALSTRAQKKRATATLGLSDTLNALIEGKVMTLVAAADYHASGYVCEHCGYLAAQALTQCPLCGSPVRPVDGMVDLAVRKAIECGSHVEVVHGVAAAELNQLGSIGAMLRF